MIKKKLISILGIAVLSATVISTGASPVFANSKDRNISQENVEIECVNEDVNEDLEDSIETTEQEVQSSEAEKEENKEENKEDTNSTETKSNSDVSVKKGLVKAEDGNWYYYKNGEKIIGLYNASPGTTYYFDENGASVKGWTEIDGNMYYFKEDIYGGGYIMARSESIDGYYFNESGIRQDKAPEIKRGWIQGEDGNWHYYDYNGKMAVGFRTVAPGVICYFDKDGISLSGWQEIQGNMYYFKESPTEPGYEMAMDETIDGHYVNHSGMREDLKKKGWVQLENTNEWVHYKENGKMSLGLVNIDGKEYLFDEETGVSLSGWQKVRGKMYYFKPSEHGFVMDSADEEFTGNPNDFVNHW